MGRTITLSQSQQRKYDRGKKKRPVGTRIPRKRFLILCEGEKTEPAYFSALKKEIPRGMLDLVIQGVGKNTLALTRRAKILVKESKRTQRPYDRVWLVFDKDSFPADNFDNTISSAIAHDFGCAWSHEAFELWYLLHFEYRNTPMSRDDYGHRISSYIKREYNKNDDSMYCELKEHQQTAIHNAERLLRYHYPAAPSASNPATQVHLLVIELNVYKRLHL